MTDVMASHATAATFGNLPHHCTKCNKGQCINFTMFLCIPPDVSITDTSIHIKQESLANAKVNARQHCVSLSSLGMKIRSERYENRYLRRLLSSLMPHISRTPVNICITLISLETTFTGLHFHRWQYGSICIQIFVVGSERQACNVIECIMAIQGHPRSLIFTPIKSSLSTSY